MMVGRAVGALSDIEWGHGRITALYVGGQRVPVTRDTVAIYDTLGGAVGCNTLPAVSPNQPKTPVRTFRVDDQRWDRVKAEAARHGVTVSDLLREMIDERLPPEEDQG